MAFDPRELAILAYANGFTLWHYATPDDPVNELKSEGYFNEASPFVEPGDMIMAKTGHGAVSCGAGAVLVVTDVSAGKVAVAPLAA